MAFAVSTGAVLLGAPPVIGASPFRSTGFRHDAPVTAPSAITRERSVTTAIYLDTERFEVAWDKPDRRGSFGRVFFGREGVTNTELVIKCPMENAKARTLYNVEEHTNAKLMRVYNSNLDKRWADFLGKIIVPRNAELSPGLSRIGLVWRYAGCGETLEEYLNSNKIFALESAMKRSTAPCTIWGGRLRVQLAERVLIELVLLLRDLAHAGIIHRDIKVRTKLARRQMSTG
jgi:hypothetical protein